MSIIKRIHNYFSPLTLSKYLRGLDKASDITYVK